MLFVRHCLTRSSFISDICQGGHVTRSTEAEGTEDMCLSRCTCSLTNVSPFMAIWCGCCSHRCCIEQRQLSSPRMRLQPESTQVRCCLSLHRTGQCRPPPPIDNLGASRRKFDRPKSKVVLSTYLTQMYDVVRPSLSGKQSDRMHWSLAVLCKRPAGMPLKTYDSVKVMLITIVLCLTVSSCQTLYSVIGESTHDSVHSLQLPSIAI